MTSLEVSSWFTYNDYYKGNLDCLEIWNKGNVSFVEKKHINLYDSEGNFYKNEIIKTYIDKESDIRIDSIINERQEIIQLDYDFYLIPTSCRLSLKENRIKTKRMLINYGLKGFDLDYKNAITEFNHYTLKRTKYKTQRPLEICFNDVYRFNTKSFMNFDYKKYIENYNIALEKYPNYKDSLHYLKEMNLNIICDFYEIDIEILKNPKFNRFKYAIKALNNKITNKKINN